MTTQILEIDSLRKTYGKGNNQTKALNGITFQVMAGEFLGIMGSSGSGKSTLLNCIATVIRPTGGRIRMRETDVHSLRGADLAEYRGKKIGYLFQSFELLDNLTGRENILLPLSLHGVPAKESRERLQSLSDYLEITDVLDKFPAQMSGGQQQRIAAARALILRPDIVLADEPTGALDSRAADSLLRIFEDVNKSGQTVFMVTHSTRAASHAGRVLFIKDGVIFHQLYRGNCSNEEMYQKISDTLTVLATGRGED